MSHCTAAETITAFNSTITKRPMSTSILPSLSLDSRPSASSKRASTPYRTPNPRRPSSTSQAALASSQSRVALNLLRRLSTQNSLRSPPFIIRDFAFKPSDPRHTGLRLPNNDNNISQKSDTNDFLELNTPLSAHARSSSKSTFWNICASPTGQGTTTESEFERDLEEAEHSMEIDKLMHQNGQDSSRNGPSNASSDCMVQQQHTPQLGENGIGGEQALSGLTSKHENLYVSLYEFVAEGTSEMNLSKGEIVAVLEIICDGWVVARKTNLLIDDDGKLFHSDLSPVLPHELPLLLSLSFNNEDHNNHQHLSLTGLCPENYLLKIS